MAAPCRQELREIRSRDEVVAIKGCVASTLGMSASGAINSQTASGASSPSDCGSGASTPVGALSRNNSGKSFNDHCSHEGASNGDNKAVAETATSSAITIKSARTETSHTEVSAPAPLHAPGPASPAIKAPERLSSSPASSISSSPSPHRPHSLLSASFKALSAMAADATARLQPSCPSPSPAPWPFERSLAHTALNYIWHRCEGPGAPIELVGGCPHHHPAATGTAQKPQLDSLRVGAPSGGRSSKTMRAPW
ncbi:hypothetical protein HYH02_004072 [Chlamydomonas schloesseri]|uniref:Uncharacterized protein n=1 Tax=Chlamydomonas schloesseri TaxID=2026947 RepID=A0A835WQC5_9CHLO|nr:hypothetical protein HYH02_004072 [Chlamydomonas schloesseri]|eukprot:KAG2451474.1 hypothetical protein HYH02_004072 [Chlamydomonas schloesseri]